MNLSIGNSNASTIIGNNINNKFLKQHKLPRDENSEEFVLKGLTNKKSITILSTTRNTSFSKEDC